MNDSVPGSNFQFSGNSLKQFARPERNGINANNQIVPVFYEFVVQNWAKLNGALRNTIYTHFSQIPGLNLVDGKVGMYVDNVHLERIYSMSAAMCSWFGVSSPDISELGSRIDGTFCLFRKSAEKGKDHIIVKSTITLELHESNSSIVALHIGHDQNGVERSSCGFVVPTESKMYFWLMPIKPLTTGYIEYIVTQRAQFEFNKSFGFIETTDSIGPGIPISARCFLKRRDVADNKYGDRIDISDTDCHNDKVIKFISKAIDTETARQIKR